MIVRVRNNQDESAVPVIKVKNPTDAENYADTVEKQPSIEGENSSTQADRDSIASTPIEVTSTPSGSASIERRDNREPSSILVLDSSNGEDQDHEDRD